MPYSITTKDGITLQNIPDDIAPDSDDLKNRVLEIRSGKQPLEIQEPGAGEQVQTGIEGIPRQLGLAGRYLMEGPAEVAGLLYDPVAAGINILTGTEIPTAGSQAKRFATSIGLPEPRTTQERVIGQASKLLAGGGGIVKGAQIAAKGGAPLAKTLAAAPEIQAGGAVGGGATGEYIKETGGGAGAQFAGALAGGFGGAGVVGATKGLVNLIQGAANYFKSGKNTLDDISVKLSNILEQSDINIKDVRLDVRERLIKEIKRANETGTPIDTNVIRRVAEYAQVGATPTKGTVTLDPILITQEKNLAKMGAQSADPELQALAQRQFKNDRILTENLNRLGADKAEDTIKAGAKIINALKETDVPKKAEVDAAYQMVRNASGRTAELDVPAFSKLANDALDFNQLGPVLPAEARAYLNGISSGEIPLNVNAMTQLDSVLSGLAHTAYVGGNKQGSLAVKVLRDALRQTPISSKEGQRAVQLYEKARGLAASRFSAIDKNPALKAALDDVAPDKFVQTYIIGTGGKANYKDVFNLSRALKSQPDAYQAAREQILQNMKMKAIGSKPDEASNFSAAGYNRALKAIGEMKLGLFFNKSELSQLRSVGKVASYEKFQPTGSAVNNSNTASAFYSLLERIVGSRLVGGLPFGKIAMQDPAQSLMLGSGKKAAMDISGAIAPKQAIKRPLPTGALLPGLLTEQE